MNTERMRHLVNRNSEHESAKKGSHFWCIIQCWNVYIVTFATALSDELNLAITRQFLRRIPAQISSKLQMDYPDTKPKDLAKQARGIEDVFALTQAHLERVHPV